MPSAVDEMLPFSLRQKYDDAPSAMHIKPTVVLSLEISTVLFNGCKYSCGKDAVKTKPRLSITICFYTNYLIIWHTLNYHFE